MTGHTPTPWANCEGAIFRVIDSRGFTVATVASDSDLRDQWEANAAFIVKAVNCHDALVQFAEFIRDGYERTDINHVDFRVGAYKAALDVLASVVGSPQDSSSRD